uniref:Uncharacterized protein n=1 Tax=Pararge aegeria TaxID=116150 RepID=S4P9D8_9NEOP
MYYFLPSLPISVIWQTHCQFNFLYTEINLISQAKYFTLYLTLLSKMLFGKHSQFHTRHSNVKTFVSKKIIGFRDCSIC